MSLRVAFLPNPPVLQSCAQQSQLRSTLACRYPGSEADMLRYIFHYANLSDFQLVPVPQYLIDLYGFSEAKLAMLDRRWADTVTGVWWNTPERSERYQLTTDLFARRMMVAYSSNNLVANESFIDAAWSLASVYAADTWVLMAVWFIMYRCYRLIAHRFQHNDRPKPFLAAVVKVIVGVALGLYTNCLLARLLNNDSYQLFMNFDEMTTQMERGRLKLLVQRGSPWYNTVINESMLTEANQRFVQVTRSNPPELIPEHIRTGETNEYVADQLLNKSLVYLDVQIEDRDLSLKSCNLRSIELPELQAYGVSLVFGKHVPRSTVSRVDAAIHSHYTAIRQLMLQHAARQKRLERLDCIRPWTYRDISLGIRKFVPLCVLFGLSCVLGVTLLLIEQYTTQKVNQWVIGLVKLVYRHKYMMG